MNNSTFLVTLLTSSNSKLLKLSYNTIIKQINHNFNYTIILVVNSLDKNYYKKFYNKFKNINVELLKLNQMENQVKVIIVYLKYLEKNSMII